MITAMEFFGVTGLEASEVLGSGENFALKDAIAAYMAFVAEKLLDFEMKNEKISPIFCEKYLKNLSFFYEKLLAENAKANENLARNFQDLVHENENLREKIAFLQRKHELMWGKISALKDDDG